MDSYDLISAAIVRQAVCDYIYCLKHNNFHGQMKLEKFFLGWWGQLLTNYHGEYIIERCKKIAGKK